MNFIEPNFKFFPHTLVGIMPELIDDLLDHALITFVESIFSLTQLFSYVRDDSSRKIS